MWRQRPTLDKWGNEKSEVIDSTSLNALALDISNATSSSKLKYHERLTNKLNDPKTFPKTYLAILKTIVNDSRIPMIPTLLVYNKLVTEFLDKRNRFNNFFAIQSTPIYNGSTVPVSKNIETRERLSTLEFSGDVIVNIIRSLDQNEAHGHDEISIRMIKLLPPQYRNHYIWFSETVLKLSHLPKKGKKQK